jgi:hypothetical protein
VGFDFSLQRLVFPIRKLGIAEFDFGVHDCADGLDDAVGALLFLGGFRELDGDYVRWMPRRSTLDVGVE